MFYLILAVLFLVYIVLPIAVASAEYLLKSLFKRD